MIEMDPPLALSRRRGLGDVSICNKTLEAECQRKETLHYSSEWVALASQERVQGWEGPECQKLKSHQRDEWPRIALQDLGIH